MILTEYVDDFAEFMETASRFFEEHFNTCEEHIAEKEVLEVDVELFQEAIDSGVANVFSIKKDNGEFVGYLNVSISPSLILAEPQAVVDFLYVLPEYRKLGYAAEAISSVEEVLGEEGVTRLSLMLPNKDYSETVAESLGYTKTSSIYNKHIGG